MIYKLHKPSKIHSNGYGYITRSGHTMFNEDIVGELNRVKSLEAENAELKAENQRLRAHAMKLDIWLEDAIHGAWSSDLDTREHALISVLNKINKLKGGGK